MRITSLTGGLAAAAIAVAGLTFTPSAQATPQPTTPTPEAVAAATWLAQASGSDGLIPGTASGESSSWAAYMNLDYGIGLALTGQNASAAAGKLAAAVYWNLGSWIPDATAPGKVGLVARAAYYLAVSGGDPKHAGASGDLVAALEGNVSDTTGVAGASNSVYDQAWAVLALKAVNSPEALKARDALLAERGYATTDVWGYDGDGNSATTNDWSNDSDGTSWALQALAPWATDPAVAPAVAAGAAFLAANQAPSGGVSAPPYLGVNAASTGLAAAAFGALGRSAEAARAATWLAAHQIGVDEPCGATVSNAGALAADEDGFKAGVGTADVETAGLATAQALEGLAYLPASSVALTAPEFVAAGGPVALSVQGLRSGQKACLTGASTPVTVGANGTASVALPAVAGTRTLTLATLGSTTSVTVKALASAKLKPTAAKKVKRGKRITVTVKGLAAGEPVTLTLGKKRLGTAKANAAGKATVKAKIAKTTKTGTKKVAVVGAFANRKGTLKVKVTR